MIDFYRYFLSIFMSIFGPHIIHELTGMQHYNFFSYVRCHFSPLEDLDIRLKSLSYTDVFLLS